MLNFWFVYCTVAVLETFYLSTMLKLDEMSKVGVLSKGEPSGISALMVPVTVSPGR
jgi:hypothetical protein